MVKTVILITLFAVTTTVKAQNTRESSHRNFPIILTIQFHALALPFQDLKTNFSNIGVGIGTEVSLNGQSNWAQQFSVALIKNRDVGNRLMFYTQPVWRPALTSTLFTELKLGIGYTIAKRPVQSYKQIDGKWISVGRKGKGLLTIPIGVSLGYNDFSENTYVSPFATYQLNLLKGYNQTVPVVPETILKTGVRIHPKYNH